MTTTMLERITVEAFLPPPDAVGFHLDADTLGTGRLGAVSAEWVPVTEPLREIQVTRGATPEKITVSPDVGTIQLTYINPDPFAWHPNTPIRITGDGHRLFTGHVLDIHTTELRKDPTNPHAITVVTAVDRVSAIANTMRYGAYLTPDKDTPWFTFETAAERFARYLNPTGWSWNGPAHLHSGWDNIGIWNLGTAQGSVVTIPATPERPSYVAYTLFEEPQGSGHAVSATFGGLPPATEVTVAVWAWNSGTDALGSLTVEGVQLPADGSPVRITKTLTTTSGGFLSVSLVPSGFTPSMATAFSFTGLTITSGPNAPVEIQNIVYESNLANHLDLTANTTKGSWWVDAHNVIQTRVTQAPDPGQTPVHYTDGTAPGPHSYVDLGISYDTATIVNDLRFENHGRVYDAEQGSFVADDTTIRAGTNETGIATVGARTASIPTAHPLSPPNLPGIAQAQVEHTAEAYLAADGTPGYAPRRIRVFNDPDNPPPVLDLRAPIDVTRREITYPCTIVGIRHGVTTQRWHTDYILIPRH